MRLCLTVTDLRPLICVINGVWRAAVLKLSNISAEITIDFTTRVTSLCNATSFIRANEGSTSQISGFIFGVHTFGVFAGVGYFSSTDVILSRDTWAHMPVLITCATLSFVCTYLVIQEKKFVQFAQVVFFDFLYPVRHLHHPNQNLHF